MLTEEVRNDGDASQASQSEKLVALPEGKDLRAKEEDEEAQHQDLAQELGQVALVAQACVVLADVPARHLAPLDAGLVARDRWRASALQKPFPQLA